jgi:hypothetical protein
MAEQHRIVSRDKWIEARKQILVKEKEFARLRDQLSQQRRDLPGNASRSSMSLKDRGTGNKGRLLTKLTGVRHRGGMSFVYWNRTRTATGVTPNTDASR